MSLLLNIGTCFSVFLNVLTSKLKWLLWNHWKNTGRPYHIIKIDKHDEPCGPVVYVERYNVRYYLEGLCSGKNYFILVHGQCTTGGNWVFNVWTVYVNIVNALINAITLTLVIPRPTCVLVSLKSVRYIYYLKSQRFSIHGNLFDGCTHWYKVMLNDPFFGLNNQNFLHDVCQELNWINIHIHFRTPLFCGTIDCPKYRSIIEQGNTGLQSADAPANMQNILTLLFYQR